MLRVECKNCAWSKQFEFCCPNCSKPFCEEDMAQATGGLLLSTVLTKKLAEDVKVIVDALQSQVNGIQTQVTNIISQFQMLSAEFNALKDQVTKCKFCNK